MFFKNITTTFLYPWLLSVASFLFVCFCCQSCFLKRLIYIQTISLFNHVLETVSKIGMLVLRSSGIEMLDIVNLIVVTIEKFITGLMDRVVARLPGDQCVFVLAAIQHTYLSSSAIRHPSDNTNSSASHLESCSDSSFLPNAIYHQNSAY